MKYFWFRIPTQLLIHLRETGLGWITGSDGPSSECTLDTACSGGNGRVSGCRTS